MSYSKDPLKAGFFVAVEGRGAKVLAVWRVNLFSSLEMSATGAVVVVDDDDSGSAWQRAMHCCQRGTARHAN